MCLVQSRCIFKISPLEKEISSSWQLAFCVVVNVDFQFVRPPNVGFYEESGNSNSARFRSGNRMSLRLSFQQGFLAICLVWAWVDT